MDKYTKIVYQSPPIGEYGIRLVLTTFDKDAFDRDMELERLEGEERERNMLYNTYRSVDNYETTCWGDTARSVVMTSPPTARYYLPNEDDLLYKLAELERCHYELHYERARLNAEIDYLNSHALELNDIYKYWRDLDD